MTGRRISERKLLQQRIHALERRVAELETSGPVRSRLRVVDDQGRPVVEVEASERGAWVALFDPEGRQVASVGSLPGSGEFAICDAAGWQVGKISRSGARGLVRIAEGEAELESPVPRARRGTPPLQAIPRSEREAKWALVKELLDDGGQGRDLAGADLQGADLRGVDLRGANLAGANLRGSILVDAWLHDAILVGADLTMAVLREGDRRVHLSGSVYDAGTRWPPGFAPRRYGCREIELRSELIPSAPPAGRGQEMAPAPPEPAAAERLRTSEESEP